MPRTSNIKINKGGEMTILPIHGDKPKMKLARFKGGKLSQKQKDYLKDMGKGAVVGGVAGLGALGHHIIKSNNRDALKALTGGNINSKKHRSNVVRSNEASRTQRPRNNDIDNMSGRQLQQYLNAKNREGRLQRNTLGSTRDVLLQEILGSMEGRGIDNHNKKYSKGISKGSGLRLPSLGGGSLDNIVKNDMRLKHLKDMGVRVDSYSPYLIKAVVDGDYRSFRTTNASEWKDLVNECALRGVQVNIMGRKTQFGKNLDGFLRNGTMGGEKINTDDQINIDIDDGDANINRSGLEGGSLTAVNGVLPTIKTPTKDSMISEIISMSVNLGYNPALDLLNSMKSSLTTQEYSDLYVYLGQNSLPLI